MLESIGVFLIGAGVSLLAMFIGECIKRRRSEPQLKREGIDHADLRTGYYVATRNPVTAGSQPEIVWVCWQVGERIVCAHRNQHEEPFSGPLSAFTFIRPWTPQ